MGKKLVYNTALLTASSLLMRCIGMAFQAWLAGRIGAAGIGLFQLVMSVGYYLMPVVLVPLLVYIYSYLLKNRSRELALYAILGLGRRHIAVILLIENLLCFALCLTLGIGAGLIGCPLVFRGLLLALCCANRRRAKSCCAAACPSLWAARPACWRRTRSLQSAATARR